MKTMPLFFKDYYKADHLKQYPHGTTKVYSNFTPRITRDPNLNFCTVFGIQGFVQEFLVDRFKQDFFDKPVEEVVRQYKRRMDTSLGPDAISMDHIRALHAVGYLPIEVKAIPEGFISRLKTPVLTITNTLPSFAWVPNFLETLISCELWPMMQSATIATAYRLILDHYAKETSDMPEFVAWQGHDFSMRGHRGIDAATKSGAAHLIAFTGTDTIPAIDYLEHYYQANAEREMIGGSVPATEHSVMCLGGKETEYETYKRLITQCYPSGIVSIVSDTWDYWKVLTETVPSLKKEILARDGKVVIRPDSGFPQKIICGDPEAPEGSPARKGSLEILWEIFGGTVNSKGYRQLNPKIGLIYGDSITMERCRAICENMKQQGFASTNVVFGIGSYTYQYNTRDTLGFAMKATYGEINGEPQILCKDPKTDDGQKKSARGLLMVNADLTYTENVTKAQEESAGIMNTVFINGVACSQAPLSVIRRRLNVWLNYWARGGK